MSLLTFDEWWQRTWADKVVRPQREHMIACWIAAGGRMTAPPTARDRFLDCPAEWAVEEKKG